MKKTIKLLLLCLSIFLISTPVNAFVLTYNREYTKNLGVNKKWIINENNRKNVLDTPLVDSEEKIYDFSNILTNGEIEILRNNIEKFVDKTNMDMVILTINEPYSYDSKNEDIAADFYDYNDFGIDFDHYSGILLLRNTYQNDPYFDIYTFGEAQIYFDYDRLENTLDYIYDDLHAGRYLSGFNKFITKISNYYDSGVPKKMRDAYIDDNGDIQYDYKWHPPLLVALIVSCIGATIYILILINKNKMVKAASKAFDYLNKESINFTNRQDVFVNSITTHYTISSNSGSGGGHSSHGSSGGGHSSGGGRHG